MNVECGVWSERREWNVGAFLRLGPRAGLYDTIRRFLFVSMRGGKERWRTGGRILEMS